MRVLIQGRLLDRIILPTDHLGAALYGGRHRVLILTCLELLIFLVELFKDMQYDDLGYDSLMPVLSMLQS